MSTLWRREFLGALGAGAAAGVLATCPASSRAGEGGAMPPAKRPNILFLFADDQRYDTIRALGNEIIQTPNLDSLVQKGTAFTLPYIMGSTQGAVCICSRSMLLTGRTLWRSPDACPRPLALWPEMLREAGYTTFVTGKWHNGPASLARCFSDGESLFFGGMHDHSRVPVQAFDPSGRYPRTRARVGQKFSSELFSDAAVEFLRRHQADKPFLLYLAYTAPHDPRRAPQRYVDLYPPEKIPLPPNFLPQHPFDNGELKVRDELLAPFPRMPEVVRKHIADYYAMITHLDEQIGRVLAALEAAGHATDTLIFFAGDNGLALGQHGLFGKQSVYEHSVRVPLLMAGPGIPRGERRDAFCYLLDLFPTVCDLLGLPTPTTVEGKSLVPILQGKARQVRDSVFAAYRDCQRMVRSERYKLIRYRVKGEQRTQLFDLPADPWETRDLSQDPAHADHLAVLDGKLREWQTAAGDRVSFSPP
jgi:arylsulfatase A-like enzyme